MSRLDKQFAAIARDMRAYDVSAEQVDAQKQRVFSAIAQYEQSVGRASMATDVVASVSRAPRDLAYAGHLFNTWFSKPVTAMVAASVVLFGGWMTTVSAASKSLPGDTLYNVKRINEYAQIQLASLDRRAVLHTEFASRRLQEVAHLQQKKDPSVAPLIKSTLSAANQEIASATEDVQELRATVDSGAAVAIAVEVQKNIDVLGSDLAETVEQSSTIELAQEATQVQEVAQAAGDTVTNAAVEAHAEQPTETSEKEITALFERMLGDASARQLFSQQRIAMAKSTLAANSYELNRLPSFSVPKFEFNLRLVENGLNEVQKPIAESAAYFAASDVPQAFSSLQVANARLRTLDDMLAEQEFILVAGLHSIANPVILHQDQPVASDPEPAPSLSSEESSEDPSPAEDQPVTP